MEKLMGLKNKRKFVGIAVDWHSHVKNKMNIIWVKYVKSENYYK